MHYSAFTIPRCFKVKSLPLPLHVVESLPSTPAARVRLLAGSGILIPILGLGVCPLCSVLAVSGGGPDIVLTTHSGRSALAYLSSVLVHIQLLPLQASDPLTFGL